MSKHGQRPSRQPGQSGLWREIYVVSAVMIDDQNAMERAWLDQLAAALNLDPGLAKELDQQVRAFSQG